MNYKVVPHSMRSSALAFTVSCASIRRTPTSGPAVVDADWNDFLRLGEEVEFVFVALQLRYAFDEYISAG